MINEIVSRLVMKAVVPRPEVTVEGNCLVLQSGWRTAALTLGGRKRKVIVDRQKSLITIQDRRFWVSSKQTIVFDRVHEVIYGYVDMGGNDWTSGNEQDLFTVGLWLKDGKVVTLFRLYGEGEYINNSILPDWMFVDEIIPGQVVKHGMDDHALSVSDVLAATIGVPVGNGPE